MIDDFLTEAQRRAVKWMTPPSTGPQWGDEPCMCDTDFTCMADEHDPDDDA